MFVLGGLALSVWRSCLSSWSPERWRGISELIPPTLQCFSQKWNPATFFHIAKHYQDRNQHMKEHTCADGSFIAICLAMALFVTVVQLCMICVGLHSSFFMKKNAVWMKGTKQLYSPFIRKDMPGKSAYFSQEFAEILRVQKQFWLVLIVFCLPCQCCLPVAVFFCSMTLILGQVVLFLIGKQA